MGFFELLSKARTTPTTETLRFVFVFPANCALLFVVPAICPRAFRVVSVLPFPPPTAFELFVPSLN